MKHMNKVTFFIGRGEITHLELINKYIKYSQGIAKIDEKISVLYKIFVGAPVLKTDIVL